MEGGVLRSGRASDRPPSQPPLPATALATGCHVLISNDFSFFFFGLVVGTSHDLVFVLLLCCSEYLGSILIKFGNVFSIGSTSSEDDISSGS